MRSRSASLVDTLALAVCSCGGLGYLPRGPATAGALFGALIYYLLQPSLLVGLAMVVLAVLIGTPLTRRVMDLTGTEDPNLVILDEVAGVWTAMLIVPPHTRLGAGGRRRLSRLRQEEVRAGEDPGSSGGRLQRDDGRCGGRPLRAHRAPTGENSS